MTADPCDDGSMKSKKDTLDNNTSKVTEEKKKTSSVNDEPVVTSCRTILVTEKKENVNVLTMKGKVYGEKELTGNNENSVKMLVNEDVYNTARRTVTSGYENEKESVSVLTMKENANGEKDSDKRRWLRNETFRHF